MTILSGILTLALAALKYWDFIDISWLLVTAPVLIDFYLKFASAIYIGSAIAYAGIRNDRVRFNYIINRLEQKVTAKYNKALINLAKMSDDFDNLHR